MTITIREGRYYWRRDGEREGPMRRRTSGSPDYPWIAPSGRCWGGDGRRHYRDWAVAELDLVGEAPAGDGWIFWRGGENPCPGQIVEYQLRQGDVDRIRSDCLFWRHIGHPVDIIAYRVIQPAPGAPPCDGRPSDESVAQRLAEKDRRIAFLENVVRRRAPQLAEKDARIKELEAESAALKSVLAEAHNKWRHEFCAAVETASDKLFRQLSYHRARSSTGSEQLNSTQSVAGSNPAVPTTPPTEQPKRETETFEERFKQLVSGPIALMSTGTFVRILSDYLEQRLGREGE